ncbi:MAG TPA: hypothetical protein VHA76_07290, partial [Solirubrobacterales bacterium]|nr:hypothetical protein [Solirubrobacterales bacterium]
CPAGVFEGEGHKVSAAALRARGLVRIRGRGQTWNAELTDRGRAFLDGSAASRPTSPRSRPARLPATDRGPHPSSTRVLDRPSSKTEQLVADVIAASGRLALPDETAKGGVNWRQRAYAAQRHGKVPDGKRLVVSRGREGFVIELKDGLTGNELGAEEIHVPARLTKYHRVARQFRDHTDLQQISRKALSRALRIIHALAVEIERRGHQIECANAPPTDRYGRRERNAKDSAHLLVTVKGHEIGLRIYEKGVGLRGTWEQQKAYYEENRLNFHLGYLPSRPTAYDKDATGQLNISLLGYSPRQTTWGDRKRWRLDDRLGQVLRELETQADEAEERRLAREREEAERQRQWEAAMADAKRRFLEDHRLDVLRRRVRAWQAADAIRAYCDAVEARYGEAATQPDTAAWLELAREHADRLQRLPTMPADPEINNEGLKPYLGSWSPYGPDRW